MRSTALFHYDFLFENGSVVVVLLSEYSTPVLLKNSAHLITDAVISNLEEFYRRGDAGQRYEPQSPLSNPGSFLREAFRDLAGACYAAYRLFRLQITQRYRYSSLGLIWAFAPSVLTAVIVFMAQRAHVTVLFPNDVPEPFYAVFGLIMLQTFLEPLNTQRNLFSANRHLLNRRGPIMEASMLSGLSDNIFSLLIKLPLLAGIFLVFNVPLAGTAALGLLGLGLTMLIGTGVGLVLAPWNGLRSDLNHMMVFLPGLLFAITPVVVEPRTSSKLYAFFQFNPLTWIFETVRNLSYGHASANDGIILILMLLIAVLVLPTSWFLCRLARPFVVERMLL